MKGLVERHYNLIKWSLALLFIPLATLHLVAFTTGTKVSFNSSDSLPNTVFFVEENASFSKGDLVQFLYKSNDKNFFPNNTKMIKKIVGVEGDKIEFKGREFFINGKSYGLAKLKSKRGQDLTKNISKTLGKDEYFVWTPHKDSFDSRYVHMGYISSKQITGTVVEAW